MTDEQLLAKDWLNRMYRVSMHISSLESKRDLVISSLSGIGTYDAEFIPSNNGLNSVETKQLNYSYYSELIEKEQKRLMSEDIRTSKVIELIGTTPEDDTLKSILNFRYLSRMPWNTVAQKMNYSMTRVFELHSIALTKIYPHIPHDSLEAP